MAAAKKTQSPKSSPFSKTQAVILVVVLLGLFFYWLRPIGFIRGPIMIIWRHPAVFTIPFFSSLFFLGLYVAIKAAKGKQEPSIKRPGFSTGEFYAWFIPGVIGLVLAAAFTSVWTTKAVYQKTNYAAISPTMLTGAAVRIKPYEVAQTQIAASLNSPTDKATNLHLVLVKGKLTWTEVRDPEGFIRSIAHHTDGLISAAAESSSPDISSSGKEELAQFKYGPGMFFTHNLTWKLHKICYTCDISEVIALPTTSGPILVAPYITWKGVGGIMSLFIKHPVFGGVFVEQPDGKIKQYSPSQAAADPILASSGHLFPEGLAQRISDAYAYKKGIFNKAFTHNEQLEVANTDENPQPYLEDFKNLGMQWVTTLKPYGSTLTTGAIMTTSAINGAVHIWRTPPASAYIGNEKALEIVRGDPGLGVIFAAPGSADSTGKFHPTEPRPIFPPGHGLQFLISVIPNAGVRVSLNVVVDAASQSVVAVFHTSPENDAALVRYLNTGQLENEQAKPEAPTKTSENSTAPSSQSAVKIINGLLVQNRNEQKNAAHNLTELKAEEENLLSLLDAAKSSHKS